MYLCTLDNQVYIDIFHSNALRYPHRVSLYIVKIDLKISFLVWTNQVLECNTPTSLYPFTEMFKSFFIGEKEIKLPIIQGGMGVGISLSGLASAVANEGGIGVISNLKKEFIDAEFLLGKDLAH